MISFHGNGVEKPHQWFRAQKFPLLVSENSRCTLWGRLIYFDEAFLPGVGKNWGTKIARRLGWGKWGHRAADLDQWIYLKKGKEELRTIPFVWFIRSRPTFRDGLLFPREDTEEQHE